MIQSLPVEWTDEKSETVSVVERAGSEAAMIAVAKGREAFTEWKATRIDRRLSVTAAFRRKLASACREIATLVADGREPEETLVSEVIPLLEACRFLEGNAARILKGRRLGGWSNPLWLRGVRHEIEREPLGVVLVIGPSNYPLFLPATHCLQALAAGNAVLLKPAPGGVTAAHVVWELLRSAGLPEDVLQVLPSEDEAAPRAIGSGVDKVIFTGSYETGVKVLMAAASGAIPSVMELSGSDGALVLADANLRLAAESIAFGLTLNRGETCIAPRRAIVEASVAREFEGLLTRALRRRGDFSISPTGATLAGIENAVRSGALVLNGSIEKGAARGPVVLTNVRPGSAVALAENWGPVLCVMEVGNAEAAVSAFNESPFGLGASVFSASEARAREIGRELIAGSVCINDLIVPTADGRIPFCGRKRSGFGATRGEEGLLEMSAPKVVSIRRGGLGMHVRRAMPGQFEMLSGYAETAHGNRWRGMQRLVSWMVRETKKRKLKSELI